MNIHDSIRKSRVYSYLMTCITIYWLQEALQWIYTLDLSTLTTQASAMVLGVLSALVALVKMIFTFASYRPPPDKLE